MSALELAERALRAAEGDEALALVQSERSGMARFAGSEVHQPTLIENETVELQVVRDGRLGIAAGNRTDEEGLRALAARAAEAADSAPPDPDFPGLAPPAEPPAVEGFDEETAALGADDQARLAAAAIDASELDLYGFVTSGVTGIAIASTTGVAVEQELTDVAALALAAVDGASGYAERTGWRLADVDPAAAAVEANEKAKLTRGADELEPGSYPAVLEAPAFAELLAYFAYDAFGALGLIEERSYAFDKLGRAGLRRALLARRRRARPARAAEGLRLRGHAEAARRARPGRRAHAASSGTARAPSAPAAGSRRPATRRRARCATGARSPFALSVAGGEADSPEELAELVGDGIYVTRLHYLSIVDPREGIVTGMTRDGTFRIRGGKIADPLVNLRFTVSVPQLLAELPGLTREPVLINQNAYYDERYPTGLRSPAIATARFDVTGVGSDPGV